MPTLIVVCGPPAAGKSILSLSLGQQLGLAVIAKDAIKEALMDHLGDGAAVGGAAFSVQFLVAAKLLNSGVGLILEGAFFRDQPELRSIATLGHTVVVHVVAPVDVLVERFTARQSQRHPGHRGLEAIPDLRQRMLDGTYEPPDLGVPLLRVDTTDGFRPPEHEILRWLCDHLVSR
jgi:predicted kinase